MKTSLKTLLFISGLLVASYGLKNYFRLSSSADLQIHFVMPIEHQALRDIIAGFQEALARDVTTPIHYTVHNAQGDANLQRSILQSLMREKTDLIVPISTTTTQMSLKIIKDKPLLSLAAMYTEADRKAHQLTGVLDEISMLQFATFVAHVTPSKGMIVLVHSADDRRVTDAQEMEALLKSKGFSVKRLMIQTLNDLYTLSQSLPATATALLIFKDNLVASGITVLKKATEEKKMLLITADEGTVKSGAPLGFGVTEKDIGREGAKLAAQILKGTSPAAIPIQHLRDLKVFVNSKFVQQNPAFQDLLEKVCTTNGYELVVTQNGDSK